jgi:hypothetical protein
VKAFLSKARAAIYRVYNGSVITASIGAIVMSVSVAAIYRPAGGILFGLFLILAALDSRS